MANIHGRWLSAALEFRWYGDLIDRPDATLMAAPIAVQSNVVSPGTPVALFQTRILNGGAENPSGNQYQVRATAGS